MNTPTTAGGRERLVDALVAAGRIRNAPVAAVFRAVPRELFLPGTAVAQAYHDDAVVTRWDSDGRPLSSSSQPLDRFRQRGLRDAQVVGGATDVQLVGHRQEVRQLPCLQPIHLPGY